MSSNIFNFWQPPRFFHFHKPEVFTGNNEGITIAVLGYAYFTLYTGNRLFLFCGDSFLLIDIILFTALNFGLRWSVTHSCGFMSSCNSPECYPSCRRPLARYYADLPNDQWHPLLRSRPLQDLFHWAQAPYLDVKSVTPIPDVLLAAGIRRQ